MLQARIDAIPLKEGRWLRFPYQAKKLALGEPRHRSGSFSSKKPETPQTLNPEPEGASAFLDFELLPRKAGLHTKARASPCKRLWRCLGLRAAQALAGVEFGV